MLIIREVQLNNFLSHDDTVLKLKPEQKLLIDGRSGAGKSSIVEALIWVLYGKGRVDNRSLIRYGAKAARVVLILEDDKDDRVLKIERSVDTKGKHGLKISEKTKAGSYLPIKVTGVKALQEHLEKEILKSSYLLFINSIAYPQDNIENFVKQTASKRKDIILEIANVSSYDLYYDKAKTELSSQESAKAISVSTTDGLRASIASDTILVEPIEKYRANELSLKEDIKINRTALDKMKAQEAVINSMRQQFNSKVSEKTTLQRDIMLYQQKVSAANKSLIELETLNVETLETEVADLEQWKKDLQAMRLSEEKVNSWKSSMLKIMQDKPIDIGYERAINEINKQLIDTMNRKTLMCPELNKECPHFSKEKNERIAQFEKQLNEKTEEYEVFKKALEGYSKKVADLGDCPETKITEIRKIESIVTAKENRKLEIDRIKNEKNAKCTILENTISEGNTILDTYTKKLVALDMEIIEFEELVKNTPSQSTEILVAESKLHTLEQQYNLVVQNLALSESAAKRIDENKEKLEKINKDILKTDENIEALQLIKGAFGQNGIKAIVIDYIIPRLEDRINDILSKLSDFRIHLETQKSGVDEDKTLEGLFISIFNESGLEFNFDNYSGGERLKIIVAISEALAEIQNIGFRVLDELFIGLDEESTEKFAEVMTTLQERFKQLFCISHLKNIKDMFSERIEIIKTNGVSQIS